MQGINRSTGRTIRIGDTKSRGDLHQTDNAYSRNASTWGRTGTRGGTCEKGENVKGSGDGCCKVNDIYVAGRSIAIYPSLFWTNTSRRRRRWYTAASSPILSRPPIVTQVRPPSPLLLPSSCQPSTFVRLPFSTWPSQYSSIYIEKINIWASSGSFGRDVNKPGCVARVSDLPRLKSLSLSSLSPLRAGSDQRRAASFPSAAFSRIALTPDYCNNVI